MNYLGNFLQKKLQEFAVSERELAKKCSISHSYLNQLIKGSNPTTNKPISPTLITFQKLSNGLGIPVHDLQRIANGIPEEVILLETEKNKIHNLRNIEKIASENGIPVGSKNDRYVPWEIWNEFKQANVLFSTLGLDPSEYDKDHWENLLEDLSLVIKIHKEKIKINKA